MTEEEQEQMEDLQDRVGPTELGRPRFVKVFNVVALIAILVVFAYRPVMRWFNLPNCREVGQGVQFPDEPGVIRIGYGCKEPLQSMPWWK